MLQGIPEDANPTWLQFANLLCSRQAQHARLNGLAVDTQQLSTSDSPRLADAMLDKPHVVLMVCLSFVTLVCCAGIASTVVCALIMEHEKMMMEHDAWSCTPMMRKMMQCLAYCCLGPCLDLHLEFYHHLDHAPAWNDLPYSTVGATFSSYCRCRAEPAHDDNTLSPSPTFHFTHQTARMLDAFWMCSFST